MSDNILDKASSKKSLYLVKIKSLTFHMLYENVSSSLYMFCKN
jgi:hypothetical protein